MNDKEKEKEAAKDEHTRLLLGELLDILTRDLGEERDESIDRIEKFVTKRRREL
jgi:hypothetical protein